VEQDRRGFGRLPVLAATILTLQAAYLGALILTHKPFKLMGSAQFLAVVAGTLVSLIATGWANSPPRRKRIGRTIWVLLPAAQPWLTLYVILALATWRGIDTAGDLGLIALRQALIVPCALTSVAGVALLLVLLPLWRDR
jgi:hypothetical protein